MGQATKNIRLLRKMVEKRGHEVLGVERFRGSHGQFRVRLRDGREVKVPFAWTMNKGERIARDLLNMKLRALERGVVPDGRRDFDCN